MVAVIKTGTSISRILNYNEAKVNQGVANCIAAINYPCEPEKMTFNIKLNRLSRCAQLNANVSRNSVHISLNFDPTDRNLTEDRLTEIAQVYMQKIGFVNQPYLVYHHHDAGHPHIHIVSVKVRPDGSRIDMQNIGRNQSENARREIEKRFGLVVADTRNKNQNQLKNTPSVAKVLYGQSETKAAIAKVLNVVLPNYKFTSLPELNAVLSEFNIMADRGNENSRTYKNGGLLYRVLDANKKSIGVPIKASKFYNAATWNSLADTFTKNLLLRQAYKPHLRNKIEQILAQKPSSFKHFKILLQSKGVNLHVRQNDNQDIYGLTFIDHTTRCIFNGSSLGKGYSAKPILERLSLFNTSSHTVPTISQGYARSASEKDHTHRSSDMPSIFAQHLPFQQMDYQNSLMQAEDVPDYLPKALTKKKKKERNLRR